MSTLTVYPKNNLTANLIFPGDKSISHRAIIFSAISNLRVQINNFLCGQDCLNTLKAFNMLGVKSTLKNNTVIINGVGLHGLKHSTEIIDVGNSGTSLRLLTGLLSAQAFNSTITGDASIQKRPMGRLIKPLRLMGAKITAKADNYAPITIEGGQQLFGINYQADISSSQIQSSLLLAGMYAKGRTTVTTPLVCRDHTQRMQNFFTKSINNKDLNINIPGDISSAAFFIVAALISKNSNITINDVGYNPGRVGLIKSLLLMGANIKINNVREICGEPIVNLSVKSSTLKAIKLTPKIIPSMIDEIPILCIAAAVAIGTTKIYGVAELQYKESNRILAMVDGLKSLGVQVSYTCESITIVGGKFSGGVVDSYCDHRIAMAFAIAGIVAYGSISILHADNIATSFPNFVNYLQKIGVKATYSKSYSL